VEVGTELCGGTTTGVAVGTAVGAGVGTELCGGTTTGVAAGTAVGVRVGIGVAVGTDVAVPGFGGRAVVLGVGVSTVGVASGVDVGCVAVGSMSGVPTVDVGEGTFTVNVGLPDAVGKTETVGTITSTRGPGNRVGLVVGAVGTGRDGVAPTDDVAVDVGSGVGLPQATASSNKTENEVQTRTDNGRSARISSRVVIDPSRRRLTQVYVEICLTHYRPVASRR
jgi:hypothetical protein